MDELLILLPIAGFIALAAGLVVVFRGTGRIVARTRELEQFKNGVKDLAARVDASLAGAAGQIDAVRRRTMGPETIGDTLVAATDAVVRYADEARSLRGPKTEMVVVGDEHASSYSSARAQIWSSGARYPSIENTPSVTMRR